MISEEKVQKAVDFLRDTAESCAKARAERLYLDEFTRSLRAEIMSEHLAEPVNAQERYALSDIRYKNHLAALKHAIYVDERGRFLRQAAEVTIEAWRTQSSNNRGLEKL